MKKLTLGASLFLLFSASTGFAQPQKDRVIRLDTPSNESIKQFVDSLNHPVTLPAKQSATDEYLISLAKAEKFNFLMDVTEISPEPVTFDAQRNRSVLWVRSDTYRFQKMIDLFFGARTDLVWKRPDIIGLAHEIVADEAKRTLATRLTETEINTRFTDYFTRVHGWDGTSQTFDAKVRVADLPADLRDEVLAEVRKGFIYKPNLRWLSNDFWKTVHVGMVRDGSKKGDKRLTIGSFNPETKEWSGAFYLGLSKTPRP